MAKAYRSLSRRGGARHGGSRHPRRRAREPWILARDAAVLALLYGSGLRIGEALGIAREDAPVGEVMR
jgi:integrase